MLCPPVYPAEQISFLAWISVLVIHAREVRMQHTTTSHDAADIFTRRRAVDGKSSAAGGLGRIVMFIKTGAHEPMFRLLAKRSSIVRRRPMNDADADAAEPLANHTRQLLGRVVVLSHWYL
jgi:hypothetical protein